MSAISLKTLRKAYSKFRRLCKEAACLLPSHREPPAHSRFATSHLFPPEREAVCAPVKKLLWAYWGTHAPYIRPSYIYPYRVKEIFSPV